MSGGSVRSGLDFPKESARRERFEPSTPITATDVQTAILQAATIGAGGSISTSLDLWLAMGDSEIVGQAPGFGPSVAAGTAKVYVGSSGTIVDANDPVPSSLPAGVAANTGSLWPAFSNAYYRGTGRKVGLVITGVGGSTQNSTADFGSGNWDLTGALYTNAINAYNAAVAAYSAAGFTVNFKGIIVCLGSNDANAIDNSTINVGQYTTSAINFHARVRSTFSNPELPIYYIQVGTNLAASDTGYAQVRTAQVGFAGPSGTDPYTFLGFINTFDFLARGLLNSGAHYTQAGYNEVGAGLASNIIMAQIEASFQRNGLDLYWSQGRVAIGYPVATAELTVNPNTAPTGAGSSAATPPLAAPANAVAHFIPLSATGGGIVFDSYGGAPIVFGRAIGGTIVAPTATPTNTFLLTLGAQGYQGGGVFASGTSGYFGLKSTEQFAAGAHGTRAEVAVTQTGTAVRTPAMGWENDGGVTVPPTVTGGSQGPGTINLQKPPFVNGVMMEDGLTLISVNTVASVANYQDTTSITSAYDSFQIVIENLIPVNNGVGVEFLVHSNSAFQATTYLNLSGGVTTYYDLLGAAATTLGNTDGVSATTTIYNANSSTLHKMLRTLGAFQLAAGGAGSANGVGYWNGGVTPIDGFEIVLTGGNIASMTVKVYGLKKAL